MTASKTTYVGPYVETGKFISLPLGEEKKGVVRPLSKKTKKTKPIFVEDKNNLINPSDLYTYTADINTFRVHAGFVGRQSTRLTFADTPTINTWEEPSFDVDIPKYTKFLLEHMYNNRELFDFFYRNIGKLYKVTSNDTKDYAYEYAFRILKREKKHQPKYPYISQTDAKLHYAERCIEHGHNIDHLVHYINGRNYKFSQPPTYTFHAFDRLPHTDTRTIFEEQISLGDYMPFFEDKHYKSNLKSTPLVDSILQRLYTHDYDLFINLFESGELHSLYDNIHSKYHYLLTAFLRELDYSCYETFILQFKLKKNSNSKIQSNILKFNAKILLNDIALFNHLHTDRPLVFVEQIESYDNLCELIDNSKKMTELLLNATPGMLTGLSDLPKEASEILTKVSEMMDDIRGTAAYNAFATQASFFENLKTNIKTKFLSIIFVLNKLWNATSLVNVLGYISLLAELLGFSEVIRNKILEKLTEVRQNYFEEQSATFQLITSISTLLTRLSPNSFLKSFKIFEALREGKAIQEITELFQQVLHEWKILENPKMKMFDLLRKEIFQLIEDYAHYEATYNERPARFIKQKLWKQFTKSHDSLRDIVNKIMINSKEYDNFMLRELTDLKRKYEVLAHEITQVRDGSCLRVEPVAFAFMGAPGIGKSKLLSRLLDTKLDGRKSILADHANKSKSKIIEELDIENWSIWAENFSDKANFADGYYGQEIHIADDVFQNSNESDHGRWINYISPQKYLTNQAALGDKGRPYKSLLIAVTANQFPNSSKTIKCVEALHRRFSVVKVVRNAKPMPTEFDPDFSHLDFHYYRTGTQYVENATPVVINLSQLTDLMLKELETKQKMYMAEAGYNTFAEQIDSNGQTPLLGGIKEIDHADCIIRMSQAIEMPARWLDMSNTFNNRFEYPYMYRQFLKIKMNVDDRNKSLSDLAAGDGTWYSTGKFVKNLNRIVNKNCFRSWDYEMYYIHTFAGKTTYYFIAKDGVRVCRLGHKDEPFDFPHPDQWAPGHGDPFEDAREEPSTEEPPQPEEAHMPEQDEYLYDYFKRKAYEVLGSIGAYMKRCIDMIKRFGLVIKDKLMNLISSVTMWVASMMPDCITEMFNCMIYSEAIGKVAGFSLITGIVSYCGLMIYNKIFSYTTETCVYCSDESLDELLKEVRDNYCGLHCLGDDHVCEQFNADIIKMKRVICGCDCDQHCLHAAIVITPKEKTRLTALFKLYTKLDDRSVKHVFGKGHGRKPLNTGFHAEDSSNSISLKKTKLNFEDSSESIKLKKSPLKFEDSSESMKLKKVKLYPEFDEQVVRDECARNLVEKLIRKSQIVVDNGKGKLLGLAFGRYVIVPAHLGRNSNTFTTIIDDKLYRLREITKNVKKDRMLLKLPTAAASFSMTAYNNLATRTTLEPTVHNADSAYQITRRNTSNFELQFQEVDVNFNIERTVVDVHSQTGYEAVEFKPMEMLRVTTLATTAVQTVSGDCGGAIIASCKQSPSKIIGFHNLGSRDKRIANCAVILTKEIVDDMIAKDVKEMEPITELTEEIMEEEIQFDRSNACQFEDGTVDLLDVMKDSSSAVIPSTGDIEYLGAYKLYAPPGNPTSLVEHALFGTFPVTKIPAPSSEDDVEDTSQLLLNGQGRPDILYTQLNKYSTVFTPIDGVHDELDDMAEQLINLFRLNMKDEDLTKMTEQEALSGRLDFPDSKPLDMTTTSGEPWSKLGFSGGKKKNAYCKITTHPESGRKLYTINRDTHHGRELDYVLKEKDILLHKGVRTLSLWKNCLKDETRPIAKARVGKTRLFTAVPMETAILSRIYFGKFKEVWQSKRKSLFHSVGINPVSLEWTQLAEYMKSKGEDFYDADFGAYDGRLRPEFMETAGRIVVDTICEVTGTETDKLAMTTLWDEYIRTHQISGRDVHIVKHGNPSGNPMTTVINCIVNLLYHWWCYIKITGNTDLNSFQRDVAFTCFGDDVIYSSNSTLTGYSFENVAKYMKVLEQDYTVASKDLNAERSAKTLDEITFLKRRFIQNYNIYMAPIDTESIEQQFNYTNISPKDFERIRVQLDEALLEAAANGKRYYNGFVDAISDGISKDLLLAGKIGISFQTYGKAYECLIDRISNS